MMSGKSMFRCTVTAAEIERIELSAHFDLLAAVAAHLRSLPSDDPSSKGHPRSIKQELET